MGPDGCGTPLWYVIFLRIPDFFCTSDYSGTLQLVWVHTPLQSTCTVNSGTMSRKGMKSSKWGFVGGPKEEILLLLGARVANRLFLPTPST